MYHIFQNNYQSVHGDPKTHNYTWLELDSPITVTHDFRDQYNNDTSRVIRRTKNIFFLTDMEFIYSPTLKIYNGFIFNFNSNKPSYGNDDSENKIYVPKITTDKKNKYHYNRNLYGGYKLQPTQPRETGNLSLYDYFSPNFPRIFTIDIITLVIMLLTYYPDILTPDLLRKLNLYFTQFMSLSYIEENADRRDSSNYIRVSPGTFAVILNSERI